MNDYDLIDPHEYVIDFDPADGADRYVFDLDIDPSCLFRKLPQPLRIEVGGQLSELRNKALDAIRQWNDADPQFPIVYQRGGSLVRIIHDAHGYATIAGLKNPHIKNVLAQVAHWVKVRTDKNGDPVDVDARPDGDVIDVVSTPDWPDIPILQGITHGPTFAEDGSLHADPGYDPKTMTYNAGRVRLGDTAPTDANIERARRLILEDLLIDFPFADDASKAHAVALLLLPFVRNLIDGPTPLHIVTSPSPGSGKGLLVGATMVPSMGRKPAAKSGDRSREEWTKSITSMLATGAAVAYFDNLTGTVSHDALAAAATEPFWSDRLFSKNDAEITVPVRCVWVLTGNNLSGNEDIARRAVLIRLDPNAPDAAQRTGFKHAHLLSWAAAHRDELATAAVTLINAWLQKGRPTWQGRTMGSFEAWSETIGGILQAVDIAGFLQTSIEVSAGFTAPKTAMIADFIRAWAEEHGEREVGVDTLFRLAGEPDPKFRLAGEPDPDAALGPYFNLLGDMLGAGNERGRKTKLGNLLQEMRDKVYRVEAEGSSDPLAGHAVGVWKVKFVKRDRMKKAVYKLERVKVFGGDSIAPTPTNGAGIGSPRNLADQGSALSTSGSAEPRNLIPYTSVGNFLDADRLPIDDREKVPRGSAVPRSTLVETAEPSDQGSAMNQYVGKLLVNGDVERIMTIATAEGLKLNQDYRIDPVRNGHVLVMFGRGW